MFKNQANCLCSPFQIKTLQTNEPNTIDCSSYDTFVDFLSKQSSSISTFEIIESTLIYANSNSNDKLSFNNMYHILYFYEKLLTNFEYTNHIAMFNQKVLRTKISQYNLDNYQKDKLIEFYNGSKSRAQIIQKFPSLKNFHFKQKCLDLKNYTDILERCNSLKRSLKTLSEILAQNSYNTITEEITLLILKERLKGFNLLAKFLISCLIISQSFVDQIKSNDIFEIHSQFKETYNAIEDVYTKYYLSYYEEEEDDGGKSQMSQSDAEENHKDKHNSALIPNEKLMNLLKDFQYKYNEPLEMKIDILENLIYHSENLLKKCGGVEKVKPFQEFKQRIYDKKFEILLKRKVEALKRLILQKIQIGAKNDLKLLSVYMNRIRLQVQYMKFSNESDDDFHLKYYRYSNSYKEKNFTLHVSNDQEDSKERQKPSSATPSPTTEKLKETLKKIKVDHKGINDVPVRKSRSKRFKRNFASANEESNMINIMEDFPEDKQDEILDEEVSCTQNDDEGLSMIKEVSSNWEMSNTAYTGRITQKSATVQNQGKSWNAISVNDVTPVNKKNRNYHDQTESNKQTIYNRTHTVNTLQHEGSYNNNKTLSTKTAKDKHLGDF